MTVFQNEINARANELTNANLLSIKKAQYDKAYSGALIDENWNGIKGIDDFQASFLDLLNERYPALFKNIQQPLEECFNEIYGSTLDDKGKSYNPKAELIMHKILLPSVGSDAWQLMYEMKSDETIFHVEFIGWVFKSIGVTH